MIRSRAIVTPPWGLAVLLLAAAVIGVACGDEDAPDPAGATLAERWLRLGEDAGTSVVVYERALPPILSDLLNPNATEDTPEADLNAVPVHPSGELLGSYMLRRPDGSHLVWLFYDVPEAEAGEVTGEVAAQLDETPWQVVGEQGNRSYTVVQFQSTRGDDVTGTTIVEPGFAGETFSVTVDRDGSEVTLEIDRGSATPMLEARLSDDLRVTSTQPGLARASGLAEGDRVVRVGETDVSDKDDLDRALFELGQGAGPVSLTYLLQIGAAGSADAAAYVPRQGLALPSEFPLRDGLSSLTVDQYQTFKDPAGNFFGASLLSEESPAVVTGRIRDALAAGNWDIVTDEPVGFATALEFRNEQERLVGSAQIDQFAEDESFTQVILQIQTAPSGG